MKKPSNEALVYPARMECDGPGDYAIVFPDVPEVVTGGATPEEAWSGAADALALALCSYPERRLPFPRPGTARKGEWMIAVHATEAAKLFIRRALAERKMTAAELARELGTDHKSVRRILSLSHRTRMDDLESILERLGVRVALTAAA